MFVSFGCQLSHLVHFYLTIYKKVLPEAKAYIKKRERKNLLDEQLGSPRTRSNNNNTDEYDNQEAKYSRLKELTRNVNRNSNSFGSGKRPGAPPLQDTFSGFDDVNDGLASFTNYTSLMDFTKEEDSFYKISGLHDIRPQIKPKKHSWPEILGPLSDKYKNYDIWKRA